MGLSGKLFGTIPLKYIHFLDKNLIDYNISHKCCDYIKGNVKHDKSPSFVGTTIEESLLRKSSWITHGCNIYTSKKILCRPISLWTEEDIWQYIKKYKIRVSDIYNKGFRRSGCISCMFGMSLESFIKSRNPEKDNRFELLFKQSRKTFENMVMSERIGLWKPLTDMWIKLDIDHKEYQQKYKKRHKQLIDWYKNYDKNILKVLNEIESRNPNVWTKNEKQQIINKYKKAQITILKGEKDE